MRSCTTVRRGVVALVLLAAISVFLLFTASPVDLLASSATCEPSKNLTSGPSASLPTSTIPLKKILYWNSFFSRDDYWFGVGRQPFVSNSCPVDNCYGVDWKHKPANIDDFSAVVFHGYHLTRGMKDLKALSANRRFHQRYVLFLLEAPSHTPATFEGFLNFFNWTMTYRRDSDIFCPYGFFMPTNSTPAYVDVRKTAIMDDWNTPAGETSDRTSLNKTDLVAWMVSNCRTPGKREVYVKELAKHIKVDIYGKCGTLSCGRNEAKACYRMLERRYKFYLSFENSLCKDYVTEKFFAVMQYRVVPVVYGGADYSRIAPPKSYIDTRDFASPKDLAEYLKYLDANSDEYNKYFRWKELYRVDVSRMNYAMCKLCEMLNDPIQPTQSYADMRQWYNAPGVCHSASSNWRN